MKNLLLTALCQPLLSGDLFLDDAGYVSNGDGSVTISLRLQN
jgi:hypothetical protein